MGCNCKANQQILKITKQYGHKINVPWKDKLMFKTQEGVKVIAIYLLFLIFSPFIFIIFFLLIRKSKNGVLKQKDFLKFFTTKRNIK
jgi:hypothetical protein